MVDDILNLQKDYYSKYSKKYKERADQKTDIRKRFGKKIKDAMKRKATKATISKLYRNLKEELMIVDSPVLERYYLARETVIELSPDKQIDSAHLMCNLTLSCQEEFGCLDTADRLNGFKTPTRKRKRDEQIGQRKRNQRKVSSNISCDHWIEGKPFCRFCNIEISLNSNKKRNFSHLLNECIGVGGTGPIQISARPPEKKRMRRLAEIGAAPDPGGNEETVYNK